jgi:hypothetical protein
MLWRENKIADRAEHVVAFSGQPIVEFWQAVLHFVGTILGILFALNGADGIVRASTQAERISAMAGFLIDRETAQERLSLLAYEETLIEKIDLAERESNPATTGPLRTKSLWDDR